MDEIKRWDDSLIDPSIHIQLQDLTTILSQTFNFTLDYTFGSFIDLEQRRITVNTLWNDTEPKVQIPSYKTDIYLRTLGTINESYLPSFHMYFYEVERSGIPKFAIQFITMLEDYRLEKMIKQDRPGTIKDFMIRQSYLTQYFSTQLQTNVTRGYKLDELFCMIYLQLQSGSPNVQFPQASQDQLDMLTRIKRILYDVYEATTTEDIVNIAIRIVFKVAHQYKDMINTYFVFPIFNWEQIYRSDTLFDELTRTDDVVNEDENQVNDEENEYDDETLSTWHHESKDQQQTFLQMDLEVGTKTNLKGGGARETDSGDQAFASVQGSSGKSKQQDYSKLEALSEQTEKKAGNQTDAPYGEDNKDAIAIYKEADEPTSDDLYTYDEYVSEIIIHKRKLANTIEKIVEHKRETPRNHLHFGRLSKNLLPIALDKNPRLFYKKDEESQHFDAIFTLMVDCSASMNQKMKDTKRGIVLFHEVLKYLKIPHQIIGFWEDSISITKHEHRNYFHMIHSFNDSLYENNGMKIMQLKPEEDNRDGFSIRVVTDKMAERREQHKFLLVFSDGEPAAANYEDNGIVDTHVAVLEARKKGINVMGMFLSDGKITEREDMVMKNIYGRERVMIPNVSELPELFAPILRRLISSMI